MRAAQAATSIIPIVFVSGGDPIASGPVSNLSRPGGNITGVSFASTPLQPKRLGLLHELVPLPATIAWLRNPRSVGFEMEGKEVPPAARELGRHLLVLNAQSVSEIDAAFATIVQSRALSLLVMPTSCSPADAGSWRRSPRVMVCLRFPIFVSLFWPAV